MIFKKPHNKSDIIATFNTETFAALIIGELVRSIKNGDASTMSICIVYVHVFLRWNVCKEQTSTHMTS